MGLSAGISDSGSIMSSRFNDQGTPPVYNQPTGLYSRPIGNPKTILLHLVNASWLEWLQSWRIKPRPRFLPLRGHPPPRRDRPPLRGHTVYSSSKSFQVDIVIVARRHMEICSIATCITRH